MILKDPGGILTPERTKTVVPAVLQRSQRQDRRIAHALHDGPRHSLLPGSHQSGNDAYQYRDSSTGRRLVQSVGLQRRNKRERDGFQAPSSTKNRSAPWQITSRSSQSRRTCRSANPGIRLRTVCSPDSRRHDFQSAPSAAHGRHRRQARTNVG